MHQCISTCTLGNTLPTNSTIRYDDMRWMPRNICKSPQEAPETTSPFWAGSPRRHRWRSWTTCRRKCSSCRRSRRSRCWRRSPWVHLQVPGSAHCWSLRHYWRSAVASTTKQGLLSGCSLTPSERCNFLQIETSCWKMLLQTRVPRDVWESAVLPGPVLSCLRRSRRSRLRCPSSSTSSSGFLVLSLFLASNTFWRNFGSSQGSFLLNIFQNCPISSNDILFQGHVWSRPNWGWGFCPKQS